MIACCISYLESPNVKIKLFTEKEVTNWIDNKLKDKKYHEVLALTMEEFVEQEQNKKQREQEAEKTQPKKGPQNPEGEEGKYFYIFIHGMQASCSQHAYSMQMETNVCELFQSTCTSAVSDADYKHCRKLKMCMKQWQCGMYDSMEFEVTKAYVTDNGNFTIVPVSIYTVCLQCANSMHLSCIK